MKSLRNIPLLIALGCFLCLNGTTCLQCVITIGCQLFNPGHHTHDLQDGCPPAGHPACPHDDGHECGHWHNCPDPQSHERVVPIAIAPSKDVKIPDAFSITGPPAPPVLSGDRFPDTLLNPRGWPTICEASSGMPLFLQYEQILI